MPDKTGKATIYRFMQVNNILLSLQSENAKLSKFILVKDRKTYLAVLPGDEEVAIFKEWVTVKK
jgi:hypothetical protein